MLYAMQDALQRAMTPVAAFAGVAAWMAHTMPLPFFAGSTRRQAEAGFSLLRRLTKPYAKPGFDITQTTTPAGPVSVDESVVLTLPFCELRHFAKRQMSRGPKILVVAPLSGHHATLLRGTVEALLEEHDVFITDWTDARAVPVGEGQFDLGDYASYVQSFVRFLGKDVHVLAVCQPCVPTLAAISLMEQAREVVVPRSLTLIAGPVDTRLSPTAVNRFATEHDLAFFQDKLIEKVPPGYAGTGRSVYPGFLQLTGFVMMNREKHRQAYSDYYQAVAAGDTDAARKHEQFYDEYNAVLDMPAEYYLETIEKIFLRADLATGGLVLAGQRVEPRSLRRTALLTIEGTKDDITGAGQTHVSHDLCSALSPAKRARLDIEGVGHYGAFSGSRFRAIAVPAIAAFIRKHA